MHILEQYSLACGLKINKPYILDKYFPLPFDKYIAFHAPSKFQSRKYDHWKHVLNLIKPYLDKNNINIVQIGDKDEQLFRDSCFITNGMTDFNQLAYIIKNSILLLGIDSFPVHLAAYYDIPLVGLYCNMYKEHSMPYWGQKQKQKLIESHRNGDKPSYSAFEAEKTINLINPEEIAKNVLDLLNIENSINVKSLYFGALSSESVIEMIPSHPIDISNLNISHINVRMDRLFNLNTLETQLEISKCCILTNKKIDLNFIKKHKYNVVKIIFFINKKEFNQKYIEDFRNLNIDYELVYKEEDENELSQLKMEYMDFAHVIKPEAPALNLKWNKNLKLISSKKTLFNKKVYPSLYHADLDVSNKDEKTFSISEEMIKNKLFLEDLNFYYIFQESA